MYIKKRNGTKEEFKPEKIEKAIYKAFKATNYEPNKKDSKIVSEFLDEITAVH